MYIYSEREAREVLHQRGLKMNGSGLRRWCRVLNVPRLSPYHWDSGYRLTRSVIESIAYHSQQLRHTSVLPVRMVRNVRSVQVDPRVCTWVFLASDTDIQAALLSAGGLRCA